MKYNKFSGTQQMKLVEHLSVERQIGKKMRFMCKYSQTIYKLMVIHTLGQRHISWVIYFYWKDINNNLFLGYFFLE
jgi:hypothetical protein